MSIYTDNGYEDRKHYLESLAEENEVPVHIVWEIANLLGNYEDFDGLVSSLKDYTQFNM